MRALLAVLLAVALVAPAPAFGQDGVVELRHIPEGRTVVIDGVRMMAYDLEGFRELARIDLRLTEAEAEALSLGDELRLTMELADARESAVLALTAQVEAAETALSESRQEILDALSALESCSGDLESAASPERIRLWHPVWAPLAIGSVSAILILMVTR